MSSDLQTGFDRGLWTGAGLLLLLIVVFIGTLVKGRQWGEDRTCKQIQSAVDILECAECGPVVRLVCGEEQTP